ncbi:MAG: hypothetical protein ABJE95_25270 [Byssovorax sp.]
MRPGSCFLACLVCVVPFVSGCLLRVGVAAVHENGASHVALDGQLGIHPLGLVRSVARDADAGFGMTLRSEGPVGAYVEGALVANKTPLKGASEGFDVFELRQMVAVDATLVGSQAHPALRPGVDVLLITEVAAFAHVNTKRELIWGETGFGAYLSGRFDRKSWAASLGIQARTCACVPHD